MKAVEIIELRDSANDTVLHRNEVNLGTARKQIFTSAL